MPPTREATTGLDRADASSTIRPMPSEREGTTTSAASSMSSRSRSRGTAPRTSTPI
jgi:hypothetical protein